VAEHNNNSELQKGITAITEKITELEKNSGSATVTDAVKSIEKSLKDLSVTMSRAISKSIPGEPEKLERIKRLYNSFIRSTH
jgi:hypothetical protein